MTPARKYTVVTKNLEINADVAFVNNLLKSEKINADAKTRALLLDIMYTLARDALFEAKRFTNLTIRSKIDVEDIRMERSLAMPAAIKDPRSKPPAAKRNKREFVSLRLQKANLKQNAKGYLNSCKPSPAKIERSNTNKIQC